MCPPPPPKSIGIEVNQYCDLGIVTVTVTDESGPLENALVRTKEWSSFTDASGTVAFPLEEGWFYISVNKTHYSFREFYAEVNCAPPECLSNEDCRSDQFCADEKCIDLIGMCGYPEDHFWVEYECCSDGDCFNETICIENFCESLSVQNNSDSM